MRAAAVAAGAVAFGCGTGSVDRRATADAAVTSAAPISRDSLAVTGPNGVEVWFTFVREDRAADSLTCLDRGLEIRRGGMRTAIPLLYTEEIPRFVNDSTLEAVLYRGCRPVDRYRVNLRTGQPTPVRPR